MPNSGYVLLALVLVSAAHGQTVDEGQIFNDLLARFTGGDANVTTGATYLYGVANGLANGFQSTLSDLYDSFLNGTEKDTVEGLVHKYKDSFCTNASYTAASSVPASFTGLGFSLTVAGGACVFNETEFAVSNGEVEIDCVGPSVVIMKTPAIFKSATTDPETFTSSSCNMAVAIDDKIDNAKTDIFGKAKPVAETDVLFVFDDKPGLLNFTAVGEQLQAEFEAVLGSVNSVLAGNPVTVNNSSDVLSALSTSLGPTADSIVGALSPASGPAIGQLIDSLSHVGQSP